jgi:AcrR family transcriptional regulator
VYGSCSDRARRTRLPRKTSKPHQAANRRPLSPERIAAAGLELADRDGVEALSMRRLADELGAGTMTLYGHFRDKRELLDAVIDAAVAESELPRLEGSLRDQVRQFATYSGELFARHPSVVEIWARQPVLGPASLRNVEAGVRILEEAGFEPEEAVKAFRLLVTYIFGFALFSMPRSAPGEREGTRTALASLPPEEYARLRETAGPFSGAMVGDETFAYGLERILDGLEASLAARGRGEPAG